MYEFAKRKRNRLEGYDYSQNGLYFITICSKDKLKTLSRIILHNPEHRLPGLIDNSMIEVQLTSIGQIVDASIAKLNDMYDFVFVDRYTIMPNHIHLIIGIHIDDGANELIPAPTISQIINHFKGDVTLQAGKPVWQKNYYDHIIRNAGDYTLTCEYIANNPLKWATKGLYEIV